MRFRFIAAATFLSARASPRTLAGVEADEQEPTFYPTYSYPTFSPTYAPTITIPPSGLYAPTDLPTRRRPFEIVSSSKPLTPKPTTTRPTSSKPSSTTVQSSTVVPTTAVTTTSETTTSKPTSAPASSPPTLEPTTPNPTFTPTSFRPTSASTSQPTTSTPVTFTPTSTPTSKPSTSQPTTAVPATFIETLSPSTAPALSITTEDSTMPQHECQAFMVQCGPSRTCADAGHQSMCCSQWGFCGNGADYCGSCCQNGPCLIALGPAPTKRPESSVKPSLQPTAKATTTSACTTSFTIETYDSIDADIAMLKESITDDEARAHFLGGIVRLAAHDFMDFNPTLSVPMGSDGCFDTAHPNNAGLETIWCDDCNLSLLHRAKYSHISRADFWVASANAIIRQTSVGNALDLIDTFRWGRIDAASCSGSGDRLPTPARCRRVERVFLDNMGLSWRDTVALLGAHTLGRGSRAFSGHHGTWKDNSIDAQVFDKQYYTELLDNTWRMRNQGGPLNGSPPQDWTTGGGNGNDRMMLNTDICLAYNIDDQINGGAPCCTHTDKTNSDGSNQCPIPNVGGINKCPMYAEGDSRRPALEAVDEFYKGDDSDFYYAFASAWGVATTVGQSNLKFLAESCI